MDEYLTPDEAREYPLSLNPFKRNHEVHALTPELRVVGFGFDFRGRGFLVRYAEIHEQSTRMMQELHESQQRINNGDIE